MTEKDYGKVEYWDARYEKQEGQIFNWLGGYDLVRSLLNEHLILPLYRKHVGAGKEESEEDQNGPKIDLNDVHAV